MNAGLGTRRHQGQMAQRRLNLRPFGGIAPWVGVIGLHRPPGRPAQPQRIDVRIVMKNRSPRKRLVMAGIRHGGDPEYQFTIHGNAASRFPPLLLKMSLIELEQWLHHLNAEPAEALQDRPRRLRPVG
jgi:hypothetical protein